MSWHVMMDLIRVSAGLRTLEYPCCIIIILFLQVVFGFPDFSQQFGPAYSDPARSVAKSGPHCPTSHCAAECCGESDEIRL